MDSMNKYYNMSMVDVAYELMSKKRSAVNFYKLWEEVCQMKKFDEIEKDDKEIELVKHINEFKNVIIDGAINRAPHKIANYIQRLAQLFHSFYNECYVIDENNLELSGQRLALVEATRITMANALNLIGVSAPEKM